MDADDGLGIGGSLGGRGTVIRRPPAAAAAILCGLALALLSGCNPQAPKPTPAPSNTPVASPTPLALHIVSQGTTRRPVRFIQQVHNRVLYELIASSAESRGPQGKARAVFDNARVTFHDRDGTTMLATAPGAVVDENTNIVTLYDGVHAKTSTGMQLQCTKLDYDRTTGMLHGSGNVVVIDPKGFRGTGSSFDSDISLTHVQMK